MELEDPQDLRARFRKFLILTNERKKMSKTTIRKRIALVAVSALTAGLFSVVTVTPAYAGIQNSTNAAAADAAFNVALLSAAGNNTGSPTIAGDGLTGVTVANMRSLGLLDKDASSTTAQTATMLSTGSLVLYTGTTATSKAMVASGGTFNPAADQSNTNTSTLYAANLRTAVFADTSTVVAATWSPGAAGTYTISLFASTATTASVTGDFPTRGANIGNITVTVIAAAAAGFSASESTCTYSNVSIVPAALDNTSATVTNGQWYINYNLVDAYGTALPAGATVATATNGALLSFGAGTSTPTAGTASTIVDSTSTGANRTIRVDQATAGAPLTTTVTLSYNGVTVCTKTVSIRGSVSTMDVSVVGTQDLGASTYDAADYNHDGAGGAGGLFIVTLKDSAGNVVLPASTGAFAETTGSTNDIIRAYSIATAATSTSSTSVHSYSRGVATCGATAGSREITLKYTNPASGVVTTSKPFTLRCADDASTYTASFDKASYVQGEVATLTVNFLDSKGNPANRKTTIAAAAAADAHIVAPMLTAVTSIVGTTANYTVRPDINGKKTYTFSVGTAAGLTAGKYNAVVDLLAMVTAGASKVTVPYTVTSGADTTTNADVLKSIVALIASINKQIQALQKLILARR
jgi:hypothetical protein